MTKKAPKHLSREAKVWWEKILREYAIDDEPGLLILQTSLEAFDRMRDAQRVIKKGLLIKDRWGQIKPNPACVIERDSRAQFLQGLKALNLDIEPLRDAPGRPPGGSKHANE